MLFTVLCTPVIPRTRSQHTRHTLYSGVGKRGRRRAGSAAPQLGMAWAVRNPRSATAANDCARLVVREEARRCPTSFAGFWKREPSLSLVRLDRLLVPPTKAYPGNDGDKQSLNHFEILCAAQETLGVGLVSTVKS